MCGGVGNLVILALPLLLFHCLCLPVCFLGCVYLSVFRALFNVCILGCLPVCISGCVYLSVFWAVYLSVFRAGFTWLYFGLGLPVCILGCTYLSVFQAVFTCLYFGLSGWLSVTLFFEKERQNLFLFCVSLVMSSLSSSLCYFPSVVFFLPPFFFFLLLL